MISRFFRLLWSVIDVLFFVLGIVALVYGAFLFGKIVGYMVLGISFIVLGIMTELAGGKGGD
ncbi:DUF1056 family protein [Ligilactobacillus faecis]|uniref:DUF1056 family protein n=1 Tax=Ligilactobacillus faecis TaxID=762833 RepID=UPI002468DB24|nr:DUF1056 family protein [Ligilactobacillus faecis]WGN89030.1 DUF1056 family protein [Ligilactobacillus faecis]